MFKRYKIRHWLRIIPGVVFMIFSIIGCSEQIERSIPIEIPRGYVPVLEIKTEGKLVRFGPFVGYYFKPAHPPDLTSLKFVCFNERNFYTLDLPENAKLFEGDALLGKLPEEKVSTPTKTSGRMLPFFFSDAPESWVSSRPEPSDEFVHFHSCYDASGPVLQGYWIRHFGTAEFVYDMGGRVGESSPLHHPVRVGVDKTFARIIELDQGPRGL